MNSIQDALTEALEHPITELPRRSRSAHRGKKPRPAGQKANETLMWSLLGSIVGSLLFYGMYRRSADGR
jgi:hypothetical protein